MVQSLNAQDLGHQGRGSKQRLVFVATSDRGSITQEARKLIKKNATQHSHKDPTRKTRKDRRTTNRGTRSPAQSTGSTSTDSSDSAYMPVITQARPVSWFPNHNISALDDPFCTWPWQIEPRLRRAWHFHRTVFEPRVIATLPASEADNAAFVDLDTRINLTNRPKFLVEMLNTCTVLHFMGAFSSKDLMALRYEAVKCIREAVADPLRDIPSLLPAVLLIGLYEWLYGDRTIATTVHLHAFRALSQLTGGAGMEYPTSGLLLVQAVDAILRNDLKEPWMVLLLRAYMPDSAQRRRLGYT